MGLSDSFDLLGEACEVFGQGNSTSQFLVFFINKIASIFRTDPFRSSSESSVVISFLIFMGQPVHVKMRQAKRSKGVWVNMWQQRLKNGGNGLFCSPGRNEAVKPLHKVLHLLPSRTNRTSFTGWGSGEPDQSQGQKIQTHWLYSQETRTDENQYFTSLPLGNQPTCHLLPVKGNKT